MYVYKQYLPHCMGVLLVLQMCFRLPKPRLYPELRSQRFSKRSHNPLRQPLRGRRRTVERGRILDHDSAIVRHNS